MPTSENNEPLLAQLQQRLREIADLEGAAAVLNWDRVTYMPPGGASARARQLATLRQLAHTKFTDPKMGELLEGLELEYRDRPYDSDEASLIRIVRRDYDRAVRIPAAFLAEFSQHRATCYEAWAKARQADDFEIVRPYLEKTLELSRERASFFPESDHIADSAIQSADYGYTVAELKPLFEQLRSQLVPIVEAIGDRREIDDSCLHQHFPEERQLLFCHRAIARMGYDFSRGRQDKTLHPFMTKFSLGDVRITTRVYESHLGQALFSSIHEAGHALYEQGISEAFEASPLGRGASSGLHESQSRLWENIVARSRGFWEYFYNQLQGVFLSQLGQISTEKFYRAINKVRRSLIRTDADEVTYNLHVAIRFDLELALLEGKLSIRDLPEAWRERYRQDLGIVPDSDRDGVLQDVHWYDGAIGGRFQSYTLGNLMSVQFYQRAIAEDPEIPVDIERGNLQTLHQWLKRNIYRHGSKYTANECLQRVTGQSLSVDPFIDYIREKYGDLYGLS